MQNTSSRSDDNTTTIISLNAAREFKKAQIEDPEYKTKVLLMSKLDLLEEMVRFQQERSRVGHLTLEMMVRGKILFKALSEQAESEELRILTSSYYRHLQLELVDYFKHNPVTKTVTIKIENG